MLKITSPRRIFRFLFALFASLGSISLAATGLFGALMFGGPFNNLHSFLVFIGAISLTFIAVLIAIYVAFEAFGKPISIDIVIWKIVLFMASLYVVYMSISIFYFSLKHLNREVSAFDSQDIMYFSFIIFLAYIVLMLGYFKIFKRRSG